MIEVRDNNLYVNGSVVVFPAEGEQILQRDVLTIVPKNNDKYHTVTVFDRIDILAYKYYSPFVEDASKYWWVIADANNIMNPLDLSEYVGQRLLIPDILRVRLLL